jgi:hypothetical protein
MTHQRWNRMNSEQRYRFLWTAYGAPEPTPRGRALVNVLSKFSLQHWTQLSVGMQQFIRRIPHRNEARIKAL